jgi:hypothetical protein
LPFYLGVAHDIGKPIFPAEWSTDMQTTTTLTRSDLAGLAQRARNGQTTSVRALRELARAAGFTTRGNCVFDPAGAYCARGWVDFGALIATGNAIGRPAADTILDFHATAEQSDAGDVAGWSEGYPGSEVVAARQAATADRNGYTAQPHDAVRHVETGAWGIVDRYREEHGGVYVYFDGDEPWDSTLVRPEDLAVVDVPDGAETVSRWDATCPACAQIPPVDENGLAARHLRRFGTWRPTYCAGRGRELFAHDRTGLQRAELLDATGEPISVTALRQTGDRLQVATIVLPGGIHVPVDQQHANGYGAELERALAAAGYRPGYGWSAYDNLADDGAVLLVRPDDTAAAETGPVPVADLSGYDVTGDAAAEWFLSDHPWAIAERTRRRRAWADKEITDAAKILAWVNRTHANDAAGELDARPAGWRDNLVRLAELTGPMAGQAQTRAAIEAAEPDDAWVAEQRRRHEIHRQVAGDDAYTYPAHLLGPGAAAYPPPGWTPTQA